MLTTFKTLLSQKKQLTKDVFLFRFQLVEPKEIHFKAGQYLILKINDKSRLYSIASPDTQKNSFEILVEIIEGGLGSTYLSNLKVGEEAVFQGPAGMFRLKENPRPKIFLVTGTGIAPVRSIIKSEIKKLRDEEIKEENNFNFSISQFPNFFLFWGLRYFSDVYFLNELKQLAIDNQQFQFHICLSREENLQMLPEEDRKYFVLGHIQDSLESVIIGCNQLKSEKNLANSNQPQSILTNFDYYLCGSRQVVEALRQYLEQKGVPASQVFFEKF